MKRMNGQWLGMMLAALLLAGCEAESSSPGDGKVDTGSEPGPIGGEDGDAAGADGLGATDPDGNTDPDADASGNDPDATMDAAAPDSATPDAGGPDAGGPDVVGGGDAAADTGGGIDAGPLTPGSCAGLPIWSAELPQSYLIAPVFTAFSPNQELLVRVGPFGGDAWWTATGESAGMGNLQLGPGTVDTESWTRYVDTISTSSMDIVVRDLDTTAVLASLPQQLPPAMASGYGAAATAFSGADLVTLTCWTAPGGLNGSMVLNWWEPTFVSFQAGPAIELVKDTNCLHFWEAGPRNIAPAPDGMHAVVAIHGTPEIAVVHKSKGVLAKANVAPGKVSVPVSNIYGLKDAYVLALAVHPSGDRVATAGADGWLRQWSLPALDEIEDAIPLGAHVVSPCTYLPSTASPITWSPAGDLLAHIAPSGAVVVRRASDWAEVAVLDGTNESRSGLCPWDDAPEARAVTGIAFTADGAQIGVTYDDGASLFACADPTPSEPPPPFTVELSGPTTVLAGQLSEWTAKVDSPVPTLTVKRFTLDGKPLDFGTLAGLLSLTLEEKGQHVIGVAADDGASEASATLEITVK